MISKCCKAHVMRVHVDGAPSYICSQCDKEHAKYPMPQPRPTRPGQTTAINGISAWELGANYGFIFGVAFASFMWICCLNVIYRIQDGSSKPSGGYEVTVESSNNEQEAKK